MHRDVYDLYRKFGREMAAESSRKIDGENPCLSGISHASRAFSLSPRRRGISDASRAFSHSARRGGPCKLFEAHGLTAFRLFPASYHYESLSGISSRQRRSDIPPRLRRGVTKHDYQESRGWRPLFRLCPTPSESELSEGLPRNEISTAYAMLTP